MAKSVILGSFLLVGGVGVAAYPAHLVEDVPGAKFNPPTQVHPNPPMHHAAAWQKV